MLCRVSFHKFQLVLGEIWLCLQRLRMTSLFLRDWFVGLFTINFDLMIIVSCVSGSCVESEHLFLRMSSANMNVQSVRSRDPEGVVTVSGFMVLVFPSTRECNAVQRSFGSRRNSYRCPSSLPVQGCYTPRAHPVVVVLSRSKFRIPSCVK